MTGTMLRLLAGVTVAAGLTVLGGGPAAGRAIDTPAGAMAYDGRFTFMRLSYVLSLRSLIGGVPRQFGPGGSVWANDYPWLTTTPAPSAT